MSIPPEPQPESAYVSTGALPADPRIDDLVERAWSAVAGPDGDGGEVSDVYPALARQDPDRWGLAVADIAGGLHVAGDAHHGFTVMSVVKPFVLALVCRDLGVAAVRAVVGVNATGLPFNSVTAVERSPSGRTNPMVNPGALLTTSLLPGTDVADRVAVATGELSRLAARDLRPDDDVLTSALATNHRNRALADLLHAVGALTADPDETVEVYTRLCCLQVTAADLAVMGATLAHGGVNPVTDDRVVDATSCRATLAAMTTAGLYETSGDWLHDVGLPGKSGIGGGIVTVSPGKGAVGSYAPRLDAEGNSVRGQAAARYLSRALGLDLFASAPTPAGTRPVLPDR